MGPWGHTGLHDLIPPNILGFSLPRIRSFRRVELKWTRLLFRRGRYILGLPQTALVHGVLILKQLCH